MRIDIAILNGLFPKPTQQLKKKNKKLTRDTKTDQH